MNINGKVEWKWLRFIKVYYCIAHILFCIFINVTQKSQYNVSERKLILKVIIYYLLHVNNHYGNHLLRMIVLRLQEIHRRWCSYKKHRVHGHIALTPMTFQRGQLPHFCATFYKIITSRLLITLKTQWAPCGHV